VIEALLAQHKAAVTHATVRVNWPGMRQDDILAGIELLGRDVLVLSPAALAGYSVLRVRPAVVA
jgi:hypothetical protein